MVMEAEKSRPRKADDIVVAHIQIWRQKGPIPERKTIRQRKKKTLFLI